MKKPRGNSRFGRQWTKAEDAMVRRATTPSKRAELLPTLDRSAKAIEMRRYHLMKRDQDTAIAKAKQEAVQPSLPFATEKPSVETSMAARHRRRWTTPDDALLTAAIPNWSDEAHVAIAAQLGRTQTSVTQRIAWLRNRGQAPVTPPFPPEGVREIARNLSSPNGHGASASFSDPLPTRVTKPGITLEGPARIAIRLSPAGQLSVDVDMT